MSDSTVFVIFGATGDLGYRKLIPALFDLFSRNMLPEQFRIVGFSRKNISQEEFREFIKESIRTKYKHASQSDIARFLQCTIYLLGEFSDANAYLRIGEALIKIDEQFGDCSNKLFHLAVPPASYGVIFENLANSGLTLSCGGGNGWTRVLVEKPFGKNLETAQELNHTLGLLFREEQIFRIDHYLAKETMQNILTFRFSNILFEPIWNNKFIERVEITLWETLDIEERGKLYDSLGALRDVGQSHILQMFAFVAMEDPRELEESLIRNARAAVLESLRPITSKDVGERVERGQYEGYLSEKSVTEDSFTETYFKVTAYADIDRWQGVPFILESGKKMGENKTEISIYFRKTETCLCPPDREQHHQNILTFRIQPDEGISVVFWAKKPGFATDLEPKKLSFLYKDSFEEDRLPDAYERVLYDCIRGDQALFTSSREVGAAWKFIESVLENWGSIELKKY